MNRHNIASWIFLIIAIILLITGDTMIAIISMLFAETQQIQSELHKIKGKMKDDI